MDGHDASFVSVTQQFNTTTSMGRLTLNMLLSFAQFEREIAGERIRDKIAASKAKGMWMGGNVPLGYDVRERKLVERRRVTQGRFGVVGCARKRMSPSPADRVARAQARAKNASSHVSLINDSRTYYFLTTV
jgi:DNA invertase Pin-like site-specific DNA recombinase